MLQHHAVWVHDLEKKIIGACMKGLQKDHTAVVSTTLMLAYNLAKHVPQVCSSVCMYVRGNVNVRVHLRVGAFACECTRVRVFACIVLWLKATTMKEREIEVLMVRAAHTHALALWTCFVFVCGVPLRYSGRM